MLTEKNTYSALFLFAMLALPQWAIAQGKNSEFETFNTLTELSVKSQRLAKSYTAAALGVLPERAKATMDSAISELNELLENFQQAPKQENHKLNSASSLLPHAQCWPSQQANPIMSRPSKLQKNQIV